MRNDLFAAMEPQQLKQVRIIGWALALGALSFAAIATALPFITGGPTAADEPPDASLVQILSTVHGALFLTGLTLAVVVPSQLAKRVPDGQKLGAFIVRWAIIEGSALFGSVIVLLAGLSGVVPDQPVFYANLVSTLALLTFVLTDTGRLSDAAKGG